MFKRGTFIYLSAIFLALVSLPAQAGARVTIFAAASLKTVLDEVADILPQDVTVAYGGSAAMARQVVQGAGADIVILAHPQWMDWLGDQGMLQEASRCDLIGNRLVLAGQVGAAPFTPLTSADLIARLHGARLASGNLRSVPVGQYTKDWLEAAGWLDDIRPHLAETNNVRLALALVARGETPLGVVYQSDVRAAPQTSVVYRVPPELYAPIVYPMALTRRAPDAAKLVMAALAGQREAFITAGFAALPAADAQACP